MADMISEVPIECSECGHDHFLPRQRVYAPCPLQSEGCGCAMDDGASLTVEDMERAANGHGAAAMSKSSETTPAMGNPSGFGICYQCRAGGHLRCVGIPCECSCPRRSDLSIMPCPFCGRTENHSEDCPLEALRERVAHLEASEAELRGAVNYLMQRSLP